MERSRDWWVQAQADLRHAHNARREGAYEWACFAATEFYTRQEADDAIRYSEAILRFCDGLLHG